MVFLPCVQENLLVFADNTKDFWDFVRRQPKILRENYRSEPEFGFKVVPCDMDMWRFARFTGIKMKTVRAFS